MKYMAIVDVDDRLDWFGVRSAVTLDVVIGLHSSMNRVSCCNDVVMTTAT